MWTPGRGSSVVVPGGSKTSDLKPKCTNRSVWSFRWGEPVPSATPATDTKPLWPGGSTLPAWMTRAEAGAASPIAAAHAPTMATRHLIGARDRTGAAPLGAPVPGALGSQPWPTDTNGCRSRST